MVGTAVYHVGSASPIQAKKASALNPGEHQIDAPAVSEASNAAVRPWMWNSGMMFRHRSSGASDRLRATCAAEAPRLR